MSQEASVLRSPGLPCATLEPLDLGAQRFYFVTESKDHSVVARLGYDEELFSELLPDLFKVGHLFSCVNALAHAIEQKCHMPF